MRKIDFSQIENNGEIDWDQPQALISTSKDLIVMSTGKPGDNCDSFSGYAFPCDLYPNGDISNSWAKSHFVKFQGKVNYVITNEE